MTPTNRPIGLAVALALLSAPSALTAEAEAEFFESQLGVLVEYYEVDLGALPPILREHQQASDASGLLKQFQAMQQAGRARLAESSYAVTTVGQSAKMKSVRELIYPTDYDPATVPGDLAGPIDPQAELIAPARPEDFESRWIGNMLEAETAPSKDGESFDIKLSSDLVEFCEFKKWGEGVSQIEQPLIHATKCDTTLTLKSGSSKLIGTYATSSDSAKRLIGFVTVMKMAAASQSEFDDFLENPPSLEEIRARRPHPDADPFAAGDDDNADEPPRQISVIAETIEVAADLASRLAHELNTISDATAIRKRLDAMITDGTAQLLDTRTIISAPGQRAVSASIREVIHPDEYDPAGQIGDPIGKPIPRVPKKVHGPITGKVDLTAPKVESAYSTHHTGIRVELEPNISTNRLISLNLALRNDRLAGELSYGRGSDATQRPLFETMDIQTNVNIADGTSLLLAIHSLETARAGSMATGAEKNAMRDRRVLAFLTAKIKTLN